MIARATRKEVGEKNLEAADLEEGEDPMEEEEGAA